MKTRTLVYISIAALVHADAAWCQEKGTDELDRWIPSFGLSIGIIRQTASAFQVNTLRPPDDQINPPAGAPGPFPGTPSEGDGSLVDPLSVFTVELMSPQIGSVPSHPRVFVHGEVGGAFGSTVELAKEGTPGPFSIPPNPFAQPSGLAVGGQGTKTSLEIGTLISGVGAGIAFTVDVLDRRLRVKPSFEYLQHRVEATGVLQNVSGANPAAFVFTSFNREEVRTLNSIGGGLELELDTLRAGPFVVAVFANGQAYRLLDDPDIDLFATDGTNAARWDVKMDRGIYRGTAGLRFRFFPEQ